jgi:APA family basic amino acid/polyamine antiporter
MPDTPTSHEEGLKREIGVFGLSANIVNIMVGAGIFVLPALVAAELGASSLLAYGFCGVLIGVIMLCFAEVGSKIPVSGGVYSYIEVAFGKYAGFLTTNVFVFGSAATADAAVANALLDTISVPLPVFAQPWFRTPVIVLFFGGLALVNVRGVKQGIGLVQLCTFGKLTPLVILALVGWRGVAGENLTFEGLPAAGSLGAASLLLFFAFQGAETGLSVGGEIKNPQRTIPRALLVSISSVLILYVTIQLVCQGVLGGSLADYPDAPLAETAGRVFGTAGATLMLAGAAISMFGNLSGEMLNLPRVIFGAARDGVIPPRKLAAVHPRYSTPHVSIFFYMSVVILFAVVGEFGQLAVLSSATVLLIYLGVALSVLRLRKTHPAGPETFRVPGGPVVPVIASLIILWFLSNLTRQEMTWMVAFLGVLTLVYVGVKKSRLFPAPTSGKS